MKILNQPNNRVSAQMAQLLREAGFPQPTAGVHQYWYEDGSSWLFQISEEDGELRQIGVENGQTSYFSGEVPPGNNASYAATIEEIIAALPSGMISSPFESVPSEPDMGQYEYVPFEGNFSPESAQLVPVDNPSPGSISVLHISPDGYGQMWLDWKARQ